MFCPISDLQGEIYQEILETEDAQLVLHAEDPCDCLSGKKRGSCCYKVKNTTVLLLLGKWTSVHAQFTQGCHKRKLEYI